jgi:hypothetical protein
MVVSNPSSMREAVRTYFGWLRTKYIVRNYEASRDISKQLKVHRV